jgi:hypothetical protein
MMWAPVVKRIGVKGKSAPLPASYQFGFLIKGIRRVTAISFLASTVPLTIADAGWLADFHDVR